MIILCTWLFVLYYTKLFGYYNVRRGLMTTPGIVFPEVPAGLLYLYSFFSGREFAFVLMWLYKLSIVNCVIAIACMLLDLAFYYADYAGFCKLQMEKYGSSCDARNKYFAYQVLLFLFLMVPLWFASANAMRRYSDEIHRPLKKRGERKPLRAEMGTIDSANMEEIKTEDAWYDLYMVRLEIVHELLNRTVYTTIA